MSLTERGNDAEGFLVVRIASVIIQHLGPVCQSCRSGRGGNWIERRPKRLQNFSGNYTSTWNKWQCISEKTLVFVSVEIDQCQPPAEDLLEDDGQYGLVDTWNIGKRCHRSVELLAPGTHLWCQELWRGQNLRFLLFPLKRSTNALGA